MFLISFEMTSLLPILILMGIGVIIPILLSVLKIKFIPIVCLEIFFGIILSIIFKNSDMFETPVVEGVYNVGLVLLLFLSGLETDYEVLKKNFEGDGVNINPFKYACIILGCVLVLSFGLSFVFSKYIIGNTFEGIYLIGVCISSTFASIVVPIIHQADFAETTCGRILATYATLSELLSIVLLSIFMLVHGVTTGNNPLWLILLLVVLGIVTFLYKKLPNDFLLKQKNKFVNARLRIALFIVLGVSIVSYISGVELIFGAFLCGMLLKWGGLGKGTETKLSIVGYGLFISMFYIIAGYKISFETIISEPKYILTVFAIIGIMLLVRIPFIILKKYYKRGTFGPSMILSCCTLVVPLSMEHLNHSTEILDPNFVECLIMASAIMIIISPIVFKISKHFNECKDEYKDVILEPGEVEVVSDGQKA